MVFKPLQLQLDVQLRDVPYKYYQLGKQQAEKQDVLVAARFLDQYENGIQKFQSGEQKLVPWSVVKEGVLDGKVVLLK